MRREHVGERQRPEPLLFYLSSFAQRRICFSHTNCRPT